MHRRRASHRPAGSRPVPIFVEKIADIQLIHGAIVNARLRRFCEAAQNETRMPTGVIAGLV
jgi:hypothetical protein